MRHGYAMLRYACHTPAVVYHYYAAIYYADGAT